MKENKLEDIVKACIAKEPAKLKDLVNDVMKSKIHDAIGDKRADVAQSIVTKAGENSEE